MLMSCTIRELQISMSETIGQKKQVNFFMTEITFEFDSFRNTRQKVMLFEIHPT